MGISTTIDMQSHNDQAHSFVLVYVLLEFWGSLVIVTM